MVDAHLQVVALLEKYRSDFATVETVVHLPPELCGTLTPRSVIEYRADRIHLWQKRGITILREDEPCGLTSLIYATKNVEETLAAVGEVATRGSSVVIFICPNDRGAARYQKLFEPVLQLPPVAKFHHKVLTLRVDDTVKALRAHGVVKKNEAGFYSIAGIFSADGIDKGSQLLADHLPMLTGDGADLCSGNGYLSLVAIERGADTVIAIEVDKRAVRAAKTICAEREVSERVTCIWSDLFSYKPSSPFDWVIMNPPFHGAQGDLDTSLGARCIATAASLLAPTGHAYMVSLTSNGYEGYLRTVFASVDVVAQKNGFSVYHAQRRLQGNRR